MNVDVVGGIRVPMGLWLGLWVLETLGTGCHFETSKSGIEV